MHSTIVRAILFISLIVLNFPVFALEGKDSISSLHDCKNVHSINVADIVVPASLFTASSLFVADGWFYDAKNDVQDALSARGKDKIKIDDYIQYSPMVAVYALDLCGVKAQHKLLDRTILLAMSWATSTILTQSMKFIFNEQRPDSEAHNSFPSSHTATVFMGAEFLRKEYENMSPWIGYSGYAVALATGYLRIYNNRHFFNDVVAGACIGVLSTRLAYWLYPKIFKKSDCNKKSDGLSIIGSPYFSTESIGLNLALTF